MTIRLYEYNLLYFRSYSYSYTFNPISEKHRGRNRSYLNSMSSICMLPYNAFHMFKFLECLFIQDVNNPVDRILVLMFKRLFISSLVNSNLRTLTRTPNMDGIKTRSHIDTKYFTHLTIMMQASSYTGMNSTKGVICLLLLYIESESLSMYVEINTD